MLQNTVIYGLPWGWLPQGYWIWCENVALGSRLGANLIVILGHLMAHKLVTPVYVHPSCKASWHPVINASHAAVAAATGGTGGRCCRAQLVLLQFKPKDLVRKNL